MSKKYKIRYAYYAELALIANQWVDYLPDLFKDKSQQEVLDAKLFRKHWLEEHYLKTPDIVTVLSNSLNEICGFYILIPLNSKAYQSILDIATKKITALPTPNPKNNNGWISIKDTVNSFEESTSIWVAMLAGRNKFSQGRATSLMLNHVRDLTPHGNIKSMLARSRTTEGKHIMVRCGFKFISNSGIAEAMIDDTWMKSSKHFD